MGLLIIMNFHQVEDVVFDDVAALNTDLLDTDLGELYEDLSIGDAPEMGGPNYSGPILYNGPNDVKIADVGDGDYFEQYDNSTQVWSCYGQDVWDAFASHMTAGKIVIHLDIEGNPDEYYVITPGSVTKPVVRF